MCMRCEAQTFHRFFFRRVRLPNMDFQFHFNKPKLDSNTNITSGFFFICFLSASSIAAAFWFSLCNYVNASMLLSGLLPYLLLVAAAASCCFHFIGVSYTYSDCVYFISVCMEFVAWTKISFWLAAPRCRGREKEMEKKPPSKTGWVKANVAVHSHEYTPVIWPCIYFQRV